MEGQDPCPGKRREDTEGEEAAAAGHQEREWELERIGQEQREGGPERAGQEQREWRGEKARRPTRSRGREQ